MRNKISILLLLLISSSDVFAQTDKTFEERAKELVSKMTLDEKILQLTSENAPPIPRLNIPAYNWHNECLHGIISDSITVFAQSIALAATFNPKLIFQIASAISDEGRVKFNKGIKGLNYWSPNLDLARDPRWGRNQETYGEDPFLAGKISVAFIKGIQGDNPKYIKAIASPKHFVAYAGPETKRHFFNAVTSQRDLWDYYLEPYRVGVEEGKTQSIMCAYTAINGVPSSVNKFLISDILRKKWNFDGFVISDCGALSDAVWGHWYANSEPEIVALALKAGLDNDCGDYYVKNLKFAISNNLITEDYVDTAVTRLFRARFRLGLFDKWEDVPYNKIPDSMMSCQKHIDLSIRSSLESIVLLKNDKNLLPLDKNLKKIFMIGPNVDVVCELLGSYHGWPNYFVSMYDGVKNKVSPETKIIKDRGSELIGSFTEKIGSQYLRTPDGKPGLLGEYFDNKDLKGKPVITRIDSVIDFQWDRNSPITGYKSEPFSVRWTGKLLVPVSGEYTFKVYSNDGTKLYIDSVKIIDNWWDHGFSPFLGFDTLTAGKEYDIRLEYYFNQSYAKVLLEFGNDETGIDQINKIIEPAKSSDVVIYVGGITSNYENEEQSPPYPPGFRGGDRTTLNLPPIQEKILKALKATGKPIVLVLFSGGCLGLNWEMDSIPAIVQVWYPGQDGGTAFADVLFGDYNPAGRLPVTWYKSIDDLPDFDNYDMNNRTYRFFKGDPLYCFGYGLSYTTFQYNSFNTDQDEYDVCKSDSINVHFRIENTGDRDGDEVVQFYTTNIDSKFPQPIKELKGFKRINVKAGQIIEDSIKISMRSLAFYDTVQSKYVINSGRYELQMGASSCDIRIKDTIYLKECTNGEIDTIDKEDIIYPNPTSDIINLSLHKYENDPVCIQIVDTFGRNLKTDIVYTDNNSSFTYDCSELESGVYYVKATIKDKTKIYKFIYLKK